MSRCILTGKAEAIITTISSNIVLDHTSNNVHAVVVSYRLQVDVGLPIHLTAANIDDRDNVPICNDPFNELDG